MATGTHDPILDQPQSIDVEEIAPNARAVYGNQDLTFAVDAQSDLHDLTWPWADAPYVRSLRLQVTDPQHEELVPLVTRYFPGYQETILGSEGMIVSKQIAAPLGSAYDRAVIWLLACQAEGDRLLRVEVEIDWGEPLTQRMVDGLLVAQHNPGQARGIYAQHNADSTRVFGNPHGRATGVELFADGRARLTYFVLVNGMVEVPLLLTVSDVGEQVAWNGFLALRDAERAFEVSTNTWEKLLKTGRLWTPDAHLNRAVQAGRLAALRSLQRLRSGLAPTDRALVRLPALVRVLDSCDPVQSENLLAHARRVAERSEGRLPARFPLRPQDAPEPATDLECAEAVTAYLRALNEHLQRRPNAELLGEHTPGVAACAEAVLRLRLEQPDGPPAVHAAASRALRQAVIFATKQHDSANALRWESEACELERLALEGGAAVESDASPLSARLAQAGWVYATDRPWFFQDPWQGIALGGEAVWGPYGPHLRQDRWTVYPKRGHAWRWWALLDLPTPAGSLSLVWDGATLHSTLPVHSDHPVVVYRRIRTRGTDEQDFNLHFEMTPADEQGGMAQRVVFRPTFDPVAPPVPPGQE